MSAQFQYHLLRFAKNLTLIINNFEAILPTRTYRNRSVLEQKRDLGGKKHEMFLEMFSLQVTVKAKQIHFHLKRIELETYAY